MLDLLCGEDAGELLEAVGPTSSPGIGDEVVVVFFDELDESIAEFIEGEGEHSPRSDYPDRLRSRSVDPTARSESVAWIVKVQGYYGFLPETAYLAVHYMDRFLSLHHLPANGWAMQLLAVTCLSLAAKMEETLVPSLLDLQVEGTRFIFESRTIRRMELLVLSALNWRLRSVTPFTFIDFFAYKVDPSGKCTTYLISRAAQVIVATIHDIEFLDHCPSSMAAAAVLCATDEIPSLAFVNPRIAVGWCTGLAEEGINSCYGLMQHLAVTDVQRKHPLILSQIRVRTTVNLVSDVSSSSPPSKRIKREVP